jgi:hypothetical protein
VEIQIAEVLAEIASKGQPMFVSPDTLDALGADPAALRDAAARLQLHTSLNFDRRGGVLVAREPDILATAERQRDGGRPVVPIIPVGLSD